MKKIFVLVIFCLPSVLFAKECNTGNETQVELNQCAHDSYQKMDSKLNQVWQSLNVCLTDDRQTFEAARVAQRSWIKHRDVQCDFEANFQFGFEGARGTAWPLGWFGCLEHMTAARIKFLETLFVGCYEHSEPGEL